MSGDYPTFSENDKENIRAYLRRKERIAAEKYYDDEKDTNHGRN
jgi:hypothetical protein